MFGEKRCSLKFRKIHRKTPAPESLFKWSFTPEARNCIKRETLAQVFSCKFCEIFKNTFFREDLRTIPSVYCELLENKVKNLLKKFYKFTNYGLRIVITWRTSNIRFLFPLKFKNKCKSCVIYKGDCSCVSQEKVRYY